VTPRERRLFGLSGLSAPAHVAAARGCERCSGIGYRGRLALFEVASDADEAPDAFGPGSLGACGLSNVLAGQTTLEETLAQCPHPDERRVAE
jgi:type II secretory ATPase GspE/PulE/Tfp pilus assembly ATPase PilB-like protein